MNIKRWYLLVVFLCIHLPISAETLRFTFADDEPPISSGVNDQAVGMIPDTLKLVFELLPSYEADVVAAPWPRAQSMVQAGTADGFLTYPSSKRKEYALFSASPAYYLDFGYLIYHRNNEHRHKIVDAQNFEALSGLTFISQHGAEWEHENIPSSITRVMANDVNAMMHLLLNRQEGDFLIMPPEQAVYVAEKFGYRENLAYQRVTFIPDSTIPFHVGIRKSYAHAEDVISQVNAVLASDEFQAKRLLILERYR